MSVWFYCVDNYDDIGDRIHNIILIIGLFELDKCDPAAQKQS